MALLTGMQAVADDLPAPLAPHAAFENPARRGFRLREGQNARRADGAKQAK
ncbi:hypothetical protein [Rhodovulum sulfidophilum]|uniref:hypothetical protein n=1 Tax=Rhodovulum sulfidophilum TaxID=35806 RepID=UPI0015C00775|nr:hypothetical protein [Rhodovulum sulfidophilum]